MNWKTAVTVAAPAPVTPVLGDIVGPSDIDLRAAALRWQARTDAFAVGKATTCLDIAARVATRGYASEKQRDYAVKLIEWSKPRTSAPAAPVYTPVPSGLPVPKLFEVMQKHATLHAGDLKISRKNQDSLCWLVWKGKAVGKIEADLATVWKGKAGADHDAILLLLAEFDADPLAAAKRHGRLSGRCSICNRDLTDPASIEAGIGPTCAERL